MYYLFIQGEKKLSAYKSNLIQVMRAIAAGTTPVFNEVRNAKTSLIESLPYNVLNGLFLIVGTIHKIPMPDIIKVSVVLIINAIFNAIANFVFVVLKHWLRIRLCQKLGLIPTEQVIAAMESLEYQSVCFKGNDFGND